MIINWALVFFVLVFIEAITLIMRFVLKKRSKDVYNRLKKDLGWKWIIRPHHGIIGLILMGIGYFDIGLGVFLSDVVHHFILFMVNGDPEFYLIQH